MKREKHYYGKFFHEGKTMHFEIIHKNFLNTVDYSELTTEVAAIHFAMNGYEPIYILKDSAFFDVLTLRDFRRFGLMRTGKNYIRQLVEFRNFNDIKKFFLDNASAERLIILKENQIFCEVNLMTEPPLINNVMKNVLALRFVKFYHDKFPKEKFVDKKVFLMSDSSVKCYFSKLFPKVVVENSTSIDVIKSKDLTKYDFVFDFYFGKGVLKMLNLNGVVDSFYDIVERSAVKILFDFAGEAKINLKFYKIPKSQELLSLNQDERKNFSAKISVAQLAENKEFLKKFSHSGKVRNFVRERKFSNSLRVDNGYYILQSDCFGEDINITNGIRKNIFFDDSAKFSVHIFGPCTVFGMFVTDSETIDSQISKMCASDELDIAVYNHGGLHGDNFLNSVMTALNTPVRTNDTFVFLDFLDDIDLKFLSDVSETFRKFNEDKSEEEIMFFDSPEHCNSKGNEIFAKIIFNDMKNFYKNFSGDKIKNFPRTCRSNQITIEDLRCTHAETINFERRLMKIKNPQQKSMVIGCVLFREDNFFQVKIENLKKILSQCDFLYLFTSCEVHGNFLVENIFDGLEKFFDVKNVLVVKADKFFCHTHFNSQDYSEGYVKNFIDITEEIFCSEISSILGVNVRFFFECEEDFATKILDKYAKVICEKYNIRAVCL